MKRIFALIMVMVLLSGCALTTIQPYKKSKKVATEPVRKSVVEKVKEVFVEKAAVVIAEEKEEILPVEEKETVLDAEEDLDIK